MRASKSVAWLAIIALGVATALAVAACGGDDGGTGTDAEYVASICKAQRTFRESLDSVDVTKLSDPSAQAKALVDPVSKYVDDIKDADPPKDVKPYHDDIVAYLEGELDKLKKGDASALQGDSPSAPDDIRARLQTVADTNEDCKATSFAF